MQEKIEVTAYLDKRRMKNDGTFPLKLRVYHSATKRTKLYPTAFSFFKSEFENIWEVRKNREEYKQPRKMIQAMITNAEDIIGELSYFSFDQFEKLLRRQAGHSDSICDQYEHTVQALRENNQFATAGNYELSLKSIKNFIKSYRGKEPARISFIEITPEFLMKYERYMINELQRSRTTVSMYLKALRSIFNLAISDKKIVPDVYPFGNTNKSKYQIPSVRKVKKALNHDQLKQLFHGTPETPEEAKAKDFWFFSYTCNGLNIKDIALLKYQHIKDDTVVIYRAKTINTSKGDLKPIVVHLTEFPKSVISKYGNKDNSPKNFVFPVLAKEMSEVEKHSKINSFTRFINRHFKKYAASIGITTEVSTYWARHSFATHAIRSGASMEFVSEALNHSNMKTTQGYFAGFTDESKKELMEKLMKF